MSTEIAGEAEVRTRHPYDGWTVLDKLSVESAREAAREAAQQLGWKDHELHQLRSVSDIVGELLWRREEARFTRRDMKRLKAENERLREHVEELGAGDARVTDAVVYDPTEERATRYMGERVIVHASKFDRLRETLTDSEEASRGE